MKKLLKILVFFIGGFFAIILLTFITLYISLNTKLPQGISGNEADAFATRMLEALDYDKYKNTRYLSWSFASHHYVWDRNIEIVTVSWDDYKVVLNLKNSIASEVSKNNKPIDINNKMVIQKALDYFNNDSFWLIAPYKIFDTGVQRSLVTLENGDEALLVQYTKGGSTPGDAYLWKVDKNYRPKSYKMWVSILPIKGLEATWSKWTTTQSGAILSQEHKILGFGLPISNIKAWN